MSLYEDFAAQFDRVCTKLGRNPQPYDVRQDYQLRLALARIKVYNRAREGNLATKRAGLIGVGLITYAEHRLETFNRRVEALA